MPVKKDEQTIGVVVVAAGASKRMNGKDKVLALLAGKPVVLHSLEPFVHNRRIDRIVLVLNKTNQKPVKDVLKQAKLTERVMTCLGGERRQDSTFAGVDKLGDCDWVIVHDCARPLVTKDFIERGLEAAWRTGVATAAVPATDTIKVANEDGLVRQTLYRESLWQTQTPQIFRSTVLAAARMHNHRDATDDTQLAEAAGFRVKLFMGSYDNIKITTPADLVIAEALLKQRKA